MPLRSVAAAALLAAGCAGAHEARTRVAAGDVAPAPWWMAELAPASASPLAGSIVLTPTSGERQSIAVISVSDPSLERSELPWRLFRGDCRSAGVPVGAPDDYPPIQLRADGNGQATATLDIEIPTSGSYSVRLFPPAARADGVLACGDLRRELP